ncbi:MAG: response regulator [Acidobacteria bacterium]|nr:response regulator [Acidobacteriota bacterium]
MSHVNILVVDDEVPIQRALRANLEARNYKVFTAGDGDEALRLVGDKDPDLIILDLGLPRRSGLEVLRSLRTWSTTPVIIVSARNGDADKIAALDEGADDYLTKPFSIGELMARVRANLRRRVQVDQSPVVRTPDFTVDFARGEVTRDGEAVHLTPIEWKIVAVLLRSEGRLVTQRALLNEVWGTQYQDETGYLRVHMTHIRRKLEPEPARPRYFRTEPGIGYRFHGSSEPARD